MARIQNQTIHITDLDNEPMIVCKGGFVTPIFELFKQFGTTLYAKYNGHNINTALSVIQEELGISIVSKLLCRYRHCHLMSASGQLIRSLLETFSWQFLH
ncbi:hypothetical protein J28TS4_15740 [Paenibacillus lautus]|nr:hypothetical protein J28TS4_15740 [Paenibacillus lautus]